MTRSKAREQAFIVLFEKSFNPETEMDDIIELSAEQGFIEKDEFALALTEKTWKKLFDIDEIIEKNLIGWKKNRISRVALSVLRLALCEIYYFDEVPVSVSINEAVELCKKYGAEDDSSFVNGILGTVARLENNESKEN